jgi:hypothetical protein
MTARFGAASPFRTCVTAIALGSCLAATPALAQQDPPPQPTPLFRAVANVVRVDTLVTERGKPVGKLTADDFELFDDGVKQQVTAASIEDVDIDVVLVLDTSRSVAGTRLQALRDAASALVRNLKPDDRAAVVTFASGVTVNAPLTTDHTAVSRRRSSTPPGRPCSSRTATIARRSC